MDLERLTMFLPLLLMGTVFLGIFWYHIMRKKAFRQFAEGRGMAFGESGLPAGVPQAIFDFPYLAARYGRIGYSASGIFEGRRAAVFDYTYKSGKHSYTVTMAWVDPGTSLPAVELRPENVLDRLAALVGWNDVNFDDDPDFSAAWHLKAPDADAARRLLGPMTRRRLLTEIGWRIEARGSSVLVYKANQRTDASGMEDYLRTAARVAAVLAGR